MKNVSPEAHRVARSRSLYLTGHPQQGAMASARFCAAVGWQAVFRSHL